MDRRTREKAGKAMGLAGSIYAVIFMVVWCGIAAAMGAWFMLIFGIPFLGFMIFRLAMCLKLMKKSQPREPWDQPDSQYRTGACESPVRSGEYCPYCGNSLEADFEFCPKCGRRQNSNEKI